MKKVLKAITTTLLVLVFVASCTKTDDPNNGGNNNSGNGGNNNGGGNSGNNTYEYVDLGLPSGILWSTCNVGASKPEEKGDLYAWAETSPKGTYHWSNYKYCYGSKDQLTKYCTDPSCGANGFADYVSILELSDDAARSNFGKYWLTPSKNEWYELLENTTSSYVSQNGVFGYRFTASNGNTLFLPMTEGYWSCNLYSMTSYAWYFDGEDLTGSARCLGLSVRPIRYRK